MCAGGNKKRAAAADEDRSYRGLLNLAKQRSESKLEQSKEWLQIRDPVPEKVSATQGGSDAVRKTMKELEWLGVGNRSRLGRRAVCWAGADRGNEA